MEPNFAPDLPICENRQSENLLSYLGSKLLDKNNAWKIARKLKKRQTLIWNYPVKCKKCFLCLKRQQLPADYK